MANKKYDVACKIGSYQTPDGKTKNKYINVGTVFENEGREFMVLNRTFNPAGVSNPENRESVILSFFEPKIKETSGYSTETPKQEDVNWTQ